MNPEQLIRIYLRECSQHAEVLSGALEEARHWLPFTPDSVDQIGKEQTRVLDQVAYRFAKLQETMGQKVLPVVLELAQEPITPDATFAVKLNWLERIGALPSADEWKMLRAARNAIAHEYPDDPELRASAVNRFLDGALRLCALYDHVARYLQDRFPEILNRQ